MNHIKKTKKVMNNLISGFLEENKITNEFERAVVTTIAPSLILYTKWVLEDAKKNEFKKLLFLMRDGKILYDIAEIIKTPLNVNIDNSILYCSRNSLRQACYHQGGSLFDLLFVYSINISLNNILERLFDTKEIETFCKKVNITRAELLKPLTKQEVLNYKRDFLDNPIAMELINEKSKYVYECCKGYFNACGVLSPEKTAVVDVGWMGSMIKNIHNIIKSDSDKQIHSYFYGMYSTPRDINKKVFHNFAFTRRTHLGNKVLFNNNLFECFCGDAQGTTLSYGKDKGEYIPILETPDETNIEIYKKQQKIILAFTKYLVSQVDINLLNNKYAIKILNRISSKPTREESEIFSVYKFSDLTNEKSLYPLCSSDFTFKQLFCCGLIGRLLMKHRLIKVDFKYAYWIEGSIQLSNVKHKKFLIFNHRLFMLCKHIVYLFKKR